MQVAAQLTPSTASRVAGEIIAAYSELRGHYPPAKSSWLWPLALSANETRNFEALWNNNIGNVTTSGSGNVSYFVNPHVSEPLKFLAFPDLRAGARSMLYYVNKYGGLDAADVGDQTGWQRALDKYLGSPYPPLWGLVAKLDSSVQPDSEHIISTPERPSGVPFGTILVGIGLATAAGYAAARWLRQTPPEEHFPDVIVMN